MHIMVIIRAIVMVVMVVVMVVNFNMVICIIIIMVKELFQNIIIQMSLKDYNLELVFIWVASTNTLPTDTQNPDFEI